LSFKTWKSVFTRVAEAANIFGSVSAIKKVQLLLTSFSKNWRQLYLQKMILKSCLSFQDICICHYPACFID